MRIFKKKSNIIIFSKDDSDYEMNDGEEIEKEKKKRKGTRVKYNKDSRYGKINLQKYFMYEVMDDSFRKSR